MGNYPTFCTAMLWPLCAIFSSVLIFAILPVQALRSPTNTTTSSHGNTHHRAKRDGTRQETLRFGCDPSLGSPKRDNCNQLLYSIYDHDPLHFLTNWLYAPAQWEHSLLWDKTCPKTWFNGWLHTLPCYLTSVGFAQKLQAD